MTEWNEYVNLVREAEILALGIVRVTPVPRQLSPSITYNVFSFLLTSLMFSRSLHKFRIRIFHTPFHQGLLQCFRILPSSRPPTFIHIFNSNRFLTLRVPRYLLPRIGHGLDLELPLPNIYKLNPTFLTGVLSQSKEKVLLN